MRVRRQDMGATFAEHALTPVFRAPTKGASQGAGRNLHPNASLGEGFDQIIMRLDPGQPLWMRQNGHIARRHHAKQQISQARRRGVVWRLDQDIARIGKRQQVAASQAVNKIGYDVIVCAGDELQGDAGIVEPVLQVCDRTTDVRSAVMKKTG
jgi:hypothetical protein